VVVWSIYGAITDGPAAIHGDMAEAYVWGQEFQLGYNQHPPFWAWIAGAWFRVLPRTGWSFDLLSVLNASLGLIGSWKLIGEFAKGDRRIAATALLLLTPFYTFLSLKYNANTIFLSIWPWTLFFFVRSIDHRRLGDAVGFGVLMALAMLSKYYAVVLGLTCLAAALAHPERRRYFTSWSPYVSTAVGLVLFSPHVWWLFHRDFLPVRYAMNLSAAHNLASRGIGGAAKFALDLVVACVAYQAVVAIVIVAARGRGARPAGRRIWRDRRLRMISILVLAPLLLTLIAGLAFRLKVSSNMMLGVFSLAPLLLIELIGVAEDARLKRLAIGLACALSILALALSPVVALTKITQAKDDPNLTLPRRELAIEATRIWRARTGLPLAYVAGGDLYPDAVAFYSPDRPHSFIHFDVRRAPWVTPDDLGRHGLLAVCAAEDVQCQALAQHFATPATGRVALTLHHTYWGHARAPHTFVLFVIPPKAQPA
jgi:4-amino-4-deoxy-L-arabinose transferase-like glycosyltransferase